MDSKPNNLAAVEQVTATRAPLPFNNFTNYEYVGCAPAASRGIPAASQSTVFSHQPDSRQMTSEKCVVECCYTHAHRMQHSCVTQIIEAAKRILNNMIL